MDETPEDWFGFVVFDDGWVTGIRYDGEQQYDFGTDEAFYRDLVSAGFPLQCDTPPLGSGALFADFSVVPSRLPLAVVTSYSQGPAPREHDMGEAGVVVHCYLARHPDVVEMVLDSVRPAGTPADA